jgi:hypothetical protein
LKDALVTKADLNQFKNEIKEEFEEKFSGIKVQVEQNSFDIHDLIIEVSGLRNDMNEKFDTVITTIDGLAGLITDGCVEKAATESALHRHEAKLDDHESRIGNLEKKAM